MSLPSRFLSRFSWPFLRLRSKPPDLDLLHLLAAQRLAGVGSWTFDIAANALICSPELRRIFCWSDDAPATMAAMFACIHSDDRAQVQAWFEQQCARATKSAACRFRLSSPRQSVLFARCAVAAADSDGQPSRLYGTIQDVTGLDLGAQARVEAEQRYEEMFEHAVAGMFQTTPDGKYLGANPALARIYGFASADELLAAFTDIGRQLYVDPGRRDAFLRKMNEQGTVSGFESQIIRRDGTVIWISESCRCVRASDGSVMYFEGTVEDITPRHQAEADLRDAKEQADAANRAKSVFLANISHELRTPLNAILGFAEILVDELFGPLGNARYREYARDIHGSGTHLLEIINDILDLAKVESGQLQLHESEIAVADLFAACERLVAGRAATDGIAIAIREPAGRMLVRTDRLRTKQILLNLLSNAIKFTPRGGRVTLSARCVRDGFEFEVSDTGIGMSSAEIAQAMRPFQQVDNSFSRSYEGTGLGLPLTKALVELHGGTLRLESVPRLGTSAIMRFPRHRLVEFEASEILRLAV